jgi:hypothetical protein
MNRKPLLLLLGACLALAWAIPATAGAATHPKVGAHQYFEGLVNGSLGTTGRPALIKVVCPGPDGRTGHPLGKQTLEVELSKAVLAGSGYTGNDATSISAFFGAPPPTAAGPGAVSFTRYGVAKAIPTSLELPCSGSGHVTFVPFPESPPTSRSASVAVEFVNVAV